MFVDLCTFAYLVSRELHGATDMVITINPRHRRYYEHRMHFMEAGPVRSYGKVGGAPAVLLRCDLENHLTLTGADRARTIYRNWPDRDEWQAAARRIRASHRGMDTDEIRYFLREATDCWKNASPEQQRYIESVVARRRAPGKSALFPSLAAGGRP